MSNIIDQANKIVEANGFKDSVYYLVSPSRLRLMHASSE